MGSPAARKGEIIRAIVLAFSDKLKFNPNSYRHPVIKYF